MIGKTPLTIDKVSPGKHKVILFLVDYEKYVQEVDVIVSKVIDVSVSLVATRIYPILTWDKTYMGDDADGTFFFIQTTDDGYAVAGTIYSKVADDGDFLVIKLDVKGNLK